MFPKLMRPKVLDNAYLGPCVPWKSVPWKLRPLHDTSLGLFVPDRCVPTLDPIQAAANITTAIRGNLGYLGCIKNFRSGTHR